MRTYCIPVVDIFFLHQHTDILRWAIMPVGVCRVLLDGCSCMDGASAAACSRDSGWAANTAVKLQAWLLMMPGLSYRALSLVTVTDHRIPHEASPAFLHQRLSTASCQHRLRFSRLSVRLPVFYTAW